MSKLKYYDGTEWKTVDGQITGDTLPIGSIIPYGSTTVPVNWLVCDGSAVSRTTYAELFAIIGTNYGAGDGSTTFNLPNYKGRVPVGYDSSDTDFNTIGETGGSKAMQEHYHNYTAGAYDFTASIKGISSGADTVVLADAGGAGTHTANAGTGNSGNLQPYQVSCFIIKAFQSAGLIASVSNTQSNSQTDVYSTKYVNDNFLKVTQLYKTTTPNNSVVNLNDNITNYEYIEVIGAGADGGRISSGKICVDNNMQINIVGTSMRDSQTTVAFWFTTLLASGTTLTPQTSKWLYITPGSSAFGFGEGNYLSVLEVLGYK